MVLAGAAGAARRTGQRRFPIWKRLHRSDSLAVSLWDQYIIADLEEAITLGRVALELRPPGHSGRALTLCNLADNLRRRFSKLGATADID